MSKIHSQTARSRSSSLPRTQMPGLSNTGSLGHNNRPNTGSQGHNNRQNQQRSHRMIPETPITHKKIKQVTKDTQRLDVKLSNLEHNAKGAINKVQNITITNKEKTEDLEYKVNHLNQKLNKVLEINEKLLKTNARTQQENENLRELMESKYDSEPLIQTNIKQKLNFSSLETPQQPKFIFPSKDRGSVPRRHSSTSNTYETGNNLNLGNKPSISTQLRPAVYKSPWTQADKNLKLTKEELEAQQKSIGHITLKGKFSGREDINTWLREKTRIAANAGIKPDYLLHRCRNGLIVGEARDFMNARSASIQTFDQLANLLWKQYNSYDKINSLEVKLRNFNQTPTESPEQMFERFKTHLLLHKETIEYQQHMRIRNGREENHYLCKQLSEIEAISMYIKGISDKVYRTKILESECCTYDQLSKISIKCTATWEKTKNILGRRNNNRSDRNSNYNKNYNNSYNNSRYNRNNRYGNNGRRYNGRRSYRNNNNDSNIRCHRCHRNNHEAKDCYAKLTVDKKPIHDDNSSDSSPRNNRRWQQTNNSNSYNTNSRQNKSNNTNRNHSNNKNSPNNTPPRSDSKKKWCRNCRMINHDTKDCRSKNNNKRNNNPSRNNNNYKQKTHHANYHLHQKNTQDSEDENEGNSSGEEEEINCIKENDNIKSHKIPKNPLNTLNDDNRFITINTAELGMVNMLVDTGASLNAISEDTYNNYPRYAQTLKIPKTVHVAGGTIQIHNFIELTIINNKNKRINTRFYVIRNNPHKIIAGRQLLSDLGLVLTYKDNYKNKNSEKENIEFHIHYAIDGQTIGAVLIQETDTEIGSVNSIVQKLKTQIMNKRKTLKNDFPIFYEIMKTWKNTIQDQKITIHTNSKETYKAYLSTAMIQSLTTTKNYGYTIVFDDGQLDPIFTEGNAILHKKQQTKIDKREDLNVKSAEIPQEPATINDIIPQNIKNKNKNKIKKSIIEKTKTNTNTRWKEAKTQIYSNNTQNMTILSNPFVNNLNIEYQLINNSCRNANMQHQISKNKIQEEILTIELETKIKTKQKKTYNKIKQKITNPGRADVSTQPPIKYQNPPLIGNVIQTQQLQGLQQPQRIPSLNYPQLNTYNLSNLLNINPNLFQNLTNNNNSLINNQFTNLSNQSVLQHPNTYFSSQSSNFNYQNTLQSQNIQGTSVSQPNASYMNSGQKQTKKQNKTPKSKNKKVKKLLTKKGEIRRIRKRLRRLQTVRNNGFKEEKLLKFELKQYQNSHKISEVQKLVECFVIEETQNEKEQIELKVQTVEESKNETTNVVETNTECTNGKNCKSMHEPKITQNHKLILDINDPRPQITQIQKILNKPITKCNYQRLNILMKSTNDEIRILRIYGNANIAHKKRSTLKDNNLCYILLNMELTPAEIAIHERHESPTDEPSHTLMLYSDKYSTDKLQLKFVGQITDTRRPAITQSNELRLISITKDWEREYITKLIENNPYKNWGLELYNHNRFRSFDYICYNCHCELQYKRKEKTLITCKQCKKETWTGGNELTCLRCNWDVCQECNKYNHRLPNL